MSPTPLSPEAVEWITRLVVNQTAAHHDAARFAREYKRKGVLRAEQEAARAQRLEAEWLRHAESLRAKGGANAG